MSDISIDQIIQEIRSVALTHKTLDTNSYVGYVTKDETQETRAYESSRIVTMLHSIDGKLKTIKVYENIRPALVKYKHIIKNDQLIIDVYDLLKYDDVQFVENLYLKLLERDVDQEGLVSNVNALRLKRASKIDLILGIVASHEYNAKGKNIKIKHLRFNIRLNKLCKLFSRIPIVGYLVQLMINLVLLNKTIRQMEDARNVLSISGNEQLLELQVKLQMQEELNHSLIGAIDQQISLYDEQMEKYNQQFNRLRDRGEALEKEVRTVYEKLSNETAQLIEKNEELKQSLDEIKKISIQVDKEDKELRMYLEQVKEVVAGQGLKLKNLSKFVNIPAQNELISTKIEEKYVRFENQFRGDEQLIRERLGHYVKKLRESFLDDQISILDIGCGRGEWLDELKKVGFENTLGIDLAESMLEEAKKKELEVIQGDGITYLKLQPNESLDVISAFQVIEHLSNNDKLELISEAKRVLKPNGVLILETPNPENVLVGSCNFYSDLTHSNPIPPETLKFYVEDEGFSDVEIIRSSPLDYFDATQIDNELKHVAYRFNMEADYAVWGCK